MAPNRTRTRHAWGAQTARKQDLKSLGKKDEARGIPDIIDQVQHYIFQRRVRVKDSFRDHDRLQCGRCTRPQFIRAVNHTVPTLGIADVEALADSYTESGPQVQFPQVVSYSKFVAKVDEVFTIAHLEKNPSVPVPRPGSALQRRSFRPTPQPMKDEARIDDILRKIKLLTETRGIIFRNCFLDCERSDATSLVCPRYGGKVTVAQFRQHFPFVRDFSESDVGLLVKRYRTDAGDIHFQALDRDIAVSGLPLSSPGAPRTGGTSTPRRQPHSAREPRVRRHLADRIEREKQHQETLRSVGVMEKLKAVVSERRLCLASYFLDFDRLRKGLVSVQQLHTVFTVLGIELEARDYQHLLSTYSNENGFVRYRDLVDEVNEGVKEMNDFDAEPPPATPGSRIRYKASLTDEQQDTIHELLISIRKKVASRNLPLKRTFQDFDKVRTGRVTRTQFSRIMDMLRIELSAEDVDFLCQAYCDTDIGSEFNYLEFIAACGQFLPNLDDTQETGRESASTPWPPRPSKYFDLDGRITPFSGFRESPTPWPAGMTTARPVTR